MAIVSDYFLKSVPKWSGTIGSGGVADSSTTTIPLSAASGLTNGEAYFFSLVEYDVNNDKTVLEVVRGTVSGTDVINCVRGVEGTAQAHDAGATVEVLFTAGQWNRLIAGLEVEHDPDGTHTDITCDSIALPADTIDDIGEIDDTLLSGSDTTLITGTAGTSGYLSKWNGDGDLVDGPELSTDGTLGDNSDSAVPTEKAVKTYVDSIGGFSMSRGYTALSGNYSSTANSSEQTISGLSTSVTDMGANMVVHATCDLTFNSSGLPAGNTTIKLKVNGTVVAERILTSASYAGYSTVSLTGQGTHSTGSNVSVTVTVQNASSNSVSILGTSAFSTVSVLVYKA